MTVSLSQVLASARARSAPLAGECAGYLVLAAADHAAQGPRRIEAGSVELHPDGSVRVVGGLPSNEAITERDLRELLDELLLVAGSVTPGLLRAARRRTGLGIDGFVREIETALIPVNRAAARRALARLERETARAVERGALVVENQRASDRVLPAEPPAASQTPPASFVPPPVSLAPPPSVPFVRPPAPLTPPISLTPPPPPASLTPPPVSSSPASRPASDLAPTPVAVPVRTRLTRPLPMSEETPSRFETRPETVVARASRAPGKASEPPAPIPEPAVASTHVSVSPSAAAPCTPLPPESMTPFLGTATAQRLSSWLPVPSAVPKVLPLPAPDNGAELDVPIDVELPVEPFVAAPLEEVAEEDIVEAAPDELTEPFYLDGDDPRDPGPLAFHELTALTGSVAPIPETVIELAESPTPAPDVSPEEVIVGAGEQVSPEEVIVGAGEQVSPEEVIVVAGEVSPHEVMVAAGEQVSPEEVIVAAAEEAAAEVCVAGADEASIEPVIVTVLDEATAEEVVVAAAASVATESGAAVDEASPEAMMVAAVAEVTREEVIVEPAVEAPVPLEHVPVADGSPVAVVPEADLAAADVALLEVEPARGEFDDVELAVLLPSAEPPPVIMRKAVVDPDSLLPRRPLPRQSTSNVDELLLSFGHGPSESGEDEDVRSTLKRLAGLEPTPPPPGASRG